MDTLVDGRYNIHIVQVVLKEFTTRSIITQPWLGSWKKSSGNRMQPWAFTNSRSFFFFIFFFFFGSFARHLNLAGHEALRPPFVPGRRKGGGKLRVLPWAAGFTTPVLPWAASCCALSASQLLLWELRQALELGWARGTAPPPFVPGRRKGGGKLRVLPWAAGFTTPVLLSCLGRLAAAPSPPRSFFFGSFARHLNLAGHEALRPPLCSRAEKGRRQTARLALGGRLHDACPALGG